LVLSRRLDSIGDRREPLGAPSEREGITSALRPLPARPSLEFEHKEPKALLRQLRAGDPNALARARARHPAMNASAAARIRLTDAQLIIAREYGCTSWPRLVRYFGDLARPRYPKDIHPTRLL
jgi:hypothetical protein